MSPSDGDPWTKSDLEDAIERGELADWKETRYETFHGTMTDEDTPYPCYFAVEAEEDGLFRYVFPGAPNDDEARSRLVRALETYLNSYESIGEISSLVVLFEPPADEQPPETYKNQFWNLLEYLGEHDPKPWPETVPTDPDHPKWRYCFAGEPMFLVARAPFYRARRSRYTPHGLEITIQPAGVFEGLSGMEDGGQRARSTIRDRLEDYDGIPRHPDSGDYADPRKREWKQYMLPETNEESVSRCPLSERSR
ncbi:MAG: YqcI/YcgG family protein [Euryarchaeota archaeon]|jgi:FPC/CPF motif-containing protein YcgG|nr:YqcI/YcgG family protein [Euryarchaeota archaeon]